ncbi:VOC family protein [Spirillospora sp. CA-142024]|uniref:VOC family protein n=1 Tax=Spirillospora sp. CA-142024 TaxID=3240036 RepID=UPI003D8E908D
MADDTSEPDVGWPAWVELATPQPDTARNFYRELFGWNVYTLTHPSYGDYDVFTLGDLQGPSVIGLRTLTDSTQPASWTCFFFVEDLQVTVEIVKAGGGQELIPPTHYTGGSAMAMCMDAQGAEFGVGLRSEVLGPIVMNEPSAMCWVELACHDVQQARRFYGKVFAWRTEDHEYQGHPYTVFRVGDRPVGGMVGMGGRWAADHPARWIPYFWAEDCDATTAEAAELGARVRFPAEDIQVGRYSMMTDPTGAPFAVMKPTSPGPGTT